MKKIPLLFRLAVLLFPASGFSQSQNTIEVLRAIPGIVCWEETFMLTYKTTGIFQQGNTFTAWFTTNSGHIIKLGSLEATGSGTITCLIPSDGIKSQSYENPITVTSTEPPVSSMPADNPAIHCGEPQLLKVQDITASSATLKWGAALCALQYRVIYKLLSSTGDGDTLFTTGTELTLTDLIPQKHYTVSVKSQCSSGMIFSHSADKKFQTNPLRMVDLSEGVLSTIVYPNPASTTLYVKQPEESEGIIAVTDLAGRIMYSQKTTGLITAIDINNFSGGTYLLKVIKGRNVYSTMFTKE